MFEDILFRVTNRKLIQYISIMIFVKYNSKEMYNYIFLNKSIYIYVP